MRQIVLDTETTGLSIEEGHRIIEIGCVELINRKLTGKHFHHYLNPERMIDSGALAVHGITNEFLQSKPSFQTIADPFIEFVKGAELIIHNAPFDLGFINAEFQKINKNAINMNDHCKVIDTLLIARQLHMGQRNSLDALCKRYNVDNKHREYHGALLDAHLLAQVYLLMTGGQGSLFNEEERVITEKKAQGTVHANQKKLPIIYANEEELAAHQCYFEILEQK